MDYAGFLNISNNFIEEIKNSSVNGSMVDLEQILTKAKIPAILQHLKHKTIVYTHYLKNILHSLKEAIEKAGWKVTVYSGDDKSCLDDFLNADADVLIAKNCLGTSKNKIFCEAPKDDLLS